MHGIGKTAPQYQAHAEKEKNTIKLPVLDKPKYEGQRDIYIQTKKQFIDAHDFAKNASDEEILDLCRHILEALDGHPDGEITLRSGKESAGSFYADMKTYFPMPDDKRLEQTNSQYKGATIATDNNPLYDNATLASGNVTAASEYFVRFPYGKEQEQLICPKQSERAKHYTDLVSFLIIASKKEKVDFFRFLGKLAGRNDIHFNLGKNERYSLFTCTHCASPSRSKTNVTE